MAIIVSCTTTSQRLRLAYHAIHSVVHQSHKPDKICLNIGDQATQSEEELYDLISGKSPDINLSIKKTPDLGPYTKLLPTLKEAVNDDIVITIDDDIIYSQDFIKKMLCNVYQYPDKICCSRAREIKKNIFGCYKNYDSWPNRYGKIIGRQILPLGVGGVAYKRELLDLDFLFDKRFLEIAPTADDLWFWAAGFLKKTEVLLDSDVDVGSIRLKHTLGLDQMNFSNSHLKEDVSILRKTLVRIRNKFIDYFGIPRTQNDEQWKSLLPLIY